MADRINFLVKQWVEGLCKGAEVPIRCVYKLWVIETFPAFRVFEYMVSKNIIYEIPTCMN